MVRKRMRGLRWIGGLAVAAIALACLAPGVGADEVEAGWYRITCKLSEKVVEVQSWSKDDGGNVAQYGYHGGDNQLWRFDPVGNGRYAIINRHSGLCLEVAGWSSAGDVVAGDEGANVRQWEYVDGDNQQWSIEAMGDGYVKIVNWYSGMCLDVSNLSESDGANIYQWGCHGYDNQRWLLEPVWRPETGVYVIRSRDSGKCLEAESGGTTGGTNAVQHEYTGANHQLWTFERIGGNGFQDAFRIKNVKSDLCLGATSSDEGPGGNGANTELWGYILGSNQEWLVEHVEGIYYRIRNWSSRKCLDVANYSKDDGGNVQQWTCGGAYNQQWSLEIVTPDHCSSCTQDAGEEGVDCGGACPDCVSLPAGWENVEAVRLRGQPDHAGLIDIVFMPEDGIDDTYKGSLSDFKSDARNAIRDVFLRLTDNNGLALPPNVEDRFNFYIYTGGFAVQILDGESCSSGQGKTQVSECLPRSRAELVEEMPGVDLIVVLRNKDHGVGYGEPTPDPLWEYEGFRVCRAARPQVLHEAGHTLFGLVDEKCKSPYWEAPKGPGNVWKTESACLTAANQYGWSQGMCRKIGSAGDCNVDWWRYDPDTCVMKSSSNPAFGEACAERITWILANWPDGR